MKSMNKDIIVILYIIYRFLLINIFAIETLKHLLPIVISNRMKYNFVFIFNSQEELNKRYN